MGRIGKWFKIDVGRGFKLWVAYLGLVAVGAVLATGLLWGNMENRVYRVTQQHTAERARLIDIIERRLPAIASTAESAARTSKEAASDAKAAVGKADAVLEKATP